jgi:acetate kinase
MDQGLPRPVFRMGLTSDDELHRTLRIGQQTNGPLWVVQGICDGLGFLGIELEAKRNAANEGVISAAASRVAVRVIRTDEERMIAKTVCRVLGLG